MINRLPGYYRKSKVVSDLYAAASAVFDKFKAYMDNEALELFITQADDFTRHESDVGITSISADAQTKRSRVLARIHGNSLFTKSELEQLIMNYEKSGCTISEDFENYTVNVLFGGRKGKPYNIGQIKAAVEEAKPAHIKVEYIFQENTWSEMISVFGRWNSISADSTWEDMIYYDEHVWIYIDREGIPYLQAENANAYIVFENGIPYARWL